MPDDKEPEFKWFKCSLNESDKCRQVLNSFFKVAQHVRLAHLANSIQAEVLRFRTEDEAVKGFTDTVSSDEEIEIAPRQAQKGISGYERKYPVVTRDAPTQAERASASGLVATALREEVADEDESEFPEEELVVEPTVLKREPVYLPVSIHFAYDAYRRLGYQEPITDWVTNIILLYFILTGVDFRLLDIPDQERLKIIEEHGLMVDTNGV